MITRPVAVREEEILRDLAGLDRRIAEGPTGKDRGSRSELSFLRELRRERQETLQKLRLSRQGVGYRQ